MSLDFKSDLIGGTVKFPSSSKSASLVSAVLVPACLLALRTSATTPHRAGPDPVTLIASAQQAIEAANSGWLPALKRHDGAALAAVYAEDGDLIALNGSAIHGRPAITAHYQAEFAKMGQILGGGVLQEGVTVSGGLIYEWGHGWLVFKRGGKRQVSSGPYLTVWRRGSDGRWRILRNLIL